MPERIEELLRSLAPDAERVALEDSASVRRRGDQRSRNQVLASAAVTVALVAGIIGVGGSLAGGDSRGIEGPPASGGPTVTTTPEPGPTDESPLTLGARPYLRDGDLTGIGPYGDFQDSGEQPTYQLMQCIDVATLGAAAKMTSTVLFEPDIGEPAVHEHALQFQSAAAAADFVGRAAETFATCDPGDPAEATVTDTGPEQVPGLDAVRGSRLTVPTLAADIGYYELGVARRANIVVVLEWSSMGNPGGKSSTNWVLTPERFQIALDRATG